MALFSRRNVQKMLNHNAPFLSLTQMQKHVDDLNQNDESSIAAEWEVALLYALSHFGRVKHEPDYGKKPDIDFTLKGHPEHSFFADIRTVSDKGYENDNPQENFVSEMNRIIRKHGLDPDKFAYQLDSRMDIKKKVKLLIPRKG